MVDDSSAAADNYVFLRGVLAAEPALRQLPSGDELCSFRITVGRAVVTRVRVDSIDCSSTRAIVRRSATRLSPGDQVEVTGALHRRFWRTPNGAPASRYEVDVTKLRLAKGTRRAGGR